MITPVQTGKSLKISNEIDAQFNTGGGEQERNRDNFNIRKKNSDFAANIGITFKTPEEFFLNEPPLPFTRDFDPSTYLNDTPKSDGKQFLSLFSSPFVVQHLDARAWRGIACVYFERAFSSPNMCPALT